MPKLELTVEQVLELVKQLPPQEQHTVLHAIIAERDLWWFERVTPPEEQMRPISAERGLDWDKMSEPEREAFIDALDLDKKRNDNQSPTQLPVRERNNQWKLIIGKKPYQELLKESQKRIHLLDELDPTTDEEVQKQLETLNYLENKLKNK